MTLLLPPEGASLKFKTCSIMLSPTGPAFNYLSALTEAVNSC